ncbi:MAG TPA: hypothetical protein VJ784_05665 [Pyrinomonadaceae bacterium]|nr:hypothetical protein [Pyrinomonadaceae bacterium]
MKPLLLALLLLLPFQQSDFGIVSKYDRFKDETSYRVTESLMPDRRGYVILSFLTTFKGEHPLLNRPATVTMLLRSYTEEWYFQDTDNTVRMIQDGQRYELGKMSIGRSDVVNNGVIEQLVLEVPFAAVERIGRAKKLEMQIGRYEVELKPETLQNIRTWAESFK